MNKTLIIIKREYLSRVKKKSFIITTLLIPFLMLSLIFLPLLMTKFKTGKDRIIVLDKSGYIKNKLNNTKSIVFIYQDSSLDAVKYSYQKAGYNGVLHIPDIDINRPMGITYYSEKQLGMNSYTYIVNEVEQILQDVRYAHAGLDKELLDKLKINLNIDTIVLSEEGEKSASSMFSFFLSYILGFTLYFSLTIYGSMVSRGIMEEKTNRIVEIIMSSVKPSQLMFGKIFGIAGVALTQFFIWIFIMMVSMTIMSAVYGPELIEFQQAKNQMSVQMDNSTVLEIVQSLQSTNISYIITIFLLYFFGGYLLYSSMFAAVSSAISDDSENQALSLPVTLPIIISFIIMINVLDDPSGKLAVLSSLFPLFSPIIMPARLAYGVPIWQIVTSLILLYITFVFVTWAAARIYRTGILMYGKKVTFREILRWIKY